MDLKYYNPEIHRASFILPEFAKKVLLIFNMHALEHNSQLFNMFHFSLTCFISFLFNIDRYSMRHDQRNPLTRFLLLPSVLTSEKCSLPHHFITVDGFPMKFFLDGGATNGQWRILAELDCKSVFSTFVGFPFQHFYFSDLLKVFCNRLISI